MKKDTIAILLLLALVLIFFTKVIISNEYFTGLDLVNAFYPWKSFLVQSVKSGELPLWNPYTFSGNPFIGNFQASIFYPLDLIYYFTSIANAFRLSLFLHIFLSGAFMYLLCRYLKSNPIASFLAAVIYMFNGFIFLRLVAGHATMINGYIWIPLIFYLCIKWLDTRNWLYLGPLSFILGIQFLAGHPQVPYYTLLVLFIYLIGYSIYQWKQDKNLRSGLMAYLFYFSAVAIAVAIAAIQILPAWRLAQFSATRAGGMLYESATYSSISWRYLLIFFAPDYFGTSIDGTFWGGNEGYVEVIGYIGILPILLMLYAWWRTWKNRYTLLFSIVLIASFLFALGKNTPIYRLFYDFVPGFNLFRCPGRWLLTVVFSSSILSGIGLHQLMNDVNDKKVIFRFLIFLIILGVIILAVIGTMQIYRSSIIPQLGQGEIARLNEFYKSTVALDKLAAMIPEDAMVNRFQVMVNALIKAFGWFLISSMVFYFYWQRKSRFGYIAIFPIVLVLINLWSFDIWYIPSVKATKYYSDYYPDSGELQYLKSDSSYYRILPLDEVLSWMHTTDSGRTSEFRANRTMLFNLDNIRGYDPMSLRYYIAYINRMLYKPLNFNQGGMLLIPSVSSCDWNMLSLLNVKYIIATNEIDHPNLNLVYSDWLKIYQNKTVFPRAYFVSGKKEITFETIDTTHVAITKYTPNRIELTVSATTTGYLVLSELVYPGWQVAVDGQQKPLLSFRNIFRSVYLPPGEHQVQFIYAPKEFRWGLIISIISLLGCLSFIITKLVIQRREPSNKTG
jgi:hypothetical protein